MSFSKEHTNDGLTIQKGAKQTGIMMVFVLFSRILKTLELYLTAANFNLKLTL